MTSTFTDKYVDVIGRLGRAVTMHLAITVTVENLFAECCAVRTWCEEQGSLKSASLHGQCTGFVLLDAAALLGVELLEELLDEPLAGMPTGRCTVVSGCSIPDLSEVGVLAGGSQPRRRRDFAA